jgi:hypothetical protein
MTKMPRQGNGGAEGTNLMEQAEIGAPPLSRQAPFPDFRGHRQSADPTLAAWAEFDRRERECPSRTARLGAVVSLCAPASIKQGDCDERIEAQTDRS